MQRLAEKELADFGRFRALPTSGGPLTTDEKLSEIGAIEALKIDNDTFAREFDVCPLENKDDGHWTYQELRRTPCPLSARALWRLRHHSSPTGKFFRTYSPGLGEGVEGPPIANMTHRRLQAAMSVQGSCHCGNVRIELPASPSGLQTVTVPFVAGSHGVSLISRRTRCASQVRRKPMSGAIE